MRARDDTSSFSRMFLLCLWVVLSWDRNHTILLCASEQCLRQSFHFMVAEEFTTSFSYVVPLRSLSLAHLHRQAVLIH